MADEGPNLASNTALDATNAQNQLITEAWQLASPELAIGDLPGENRKMDEEKKPEMNARRSTRLTILDEAAKLVEKTWSVLGKRGRDALEIKAQEIQALSGQAERSNKSTDPNVLKCEEPLTKRACVSSHVCEPNMPPTLETENKVTRKSIAKRWLSHGLYIGQDQDSGSRIRQKRIKLRTSSDDSSKIQPRRFLPMPMFRGHRMIEMGRDFKLPFDIFSPLPPGQPRPEEWKKTHKSET